MLANLTCQISAILYADRGDRKKSQSLHRAHLTIFADRGDRLIKSPGVSPTLVMPVSFLTLLALQILASTGDTHHTHGTVMHRKVQEHWKPFASGNLFSLCCWSVEIHNDGVSSDSAIRFSNSSNPLMFVSTLYKSKQRKQYLLAEY